MRRLTLAALLVVAAACHSATEPAPPAEIFQLRSVDGRPLPTTRSTNPSSNGAAILHEELILDERGVATRNTTVQGATPSTPVTTTITYAYTRIGSLISLGNVLCGPAALCIQHFPELGPIDGDTLTLGPAPSLLPTGGSLLVYRRLMLID